MRLTSPSGRALQIVAAVILLCLGLIFVLPMAWIVVASFDESATLAVSWPQQWTLANYSAILTPELLATPMINSFLLSAGTALLTVVVSILAAYPLSRYRSRFNRPFLYGVLFATCLPITAMMVPVYNLFVWLNLIDSIGGTILFLTATSIPMALWMMKNFIDSVPRTMEEAAWVDGASAMRTLASVVVPLIRPGIAVVFIYVFVQAWGNFFVPFVLLLTLDKQPAAVSVYSFFGEYGTVIYGQLAAYSLAYSVPVLVLYVLVSRVLGGSNALAGGLKG